MGAGGARAAAAYPALKLGATRLTLVDKDLQRAVALCAPLKSHRVSVAREISLDAADGLIHAARMHGHFISAA